MIEFIKKKYRKIKFVYNQLKLFYSVNWTKTLYFNFKKLPFSVAKKLPVFFYGKVKFQSLKGEIQLNTPIKMGMIGFGQSYEMRTVSKGTAELFLEGLIVFNGYMQFGKDYFIYVAKNASCEFGNMASLASDGKIISIEKIVLGDYARLGSECQIIDTNFHHMINTQTNDKYPMTSPITIGEYNFIGNRVSIMSKTKTPNFCTISSNSLCNKDYSSFGENVLIGGIPSKLLKENISRDWNGEMESLNCFLKLFK